jgi:hypothetical protein
LPVRRGLLWYLDVFNYRKAADGPGTFEILSPLFHERSPLRRPFFARAVQAAAHQPN